ncbi:putative HNHc nuclease [Caminicella sporogenes]|uniref:putative HNHc nuclease n=1 Tax=Caminicella sporogenes TaxID=166485 RepID=UPI0025403118|nr:putative HNHc nuclease [Caminicella sporogenes]WIF95046.1 putative HNHc nuclease [Caminicella sporogenes]
MKIKCVIDNYRGRKKGMALILGIPEEEQLKVLQHLPNFVDKPLEVDIRIDAKEYQEELKQISDEQRKKVYALIKDIADSIGDTVDNMKYNLKIAFIQQSEYNDFSLSNCSKELATDFIEFLLNFAFENGVRLKEHPRNSFDNIERYFAITVKNRICAVCGKRGDIHHIDAIGMGNNRNKVDDSLHRKICLCRSHHTEAHQIGWPKFIKKYHLGG